VPMWDYAELTVLEDRVLITYSDFGQPTTQFSCSSWSDIEAVKAGTENPIGFKSRPENGPLREALNYLGTLGWELVAALDREPLVMYFKRPPQAAASG
jgi:hypothetical protein